MEINNGIIINGELHELVEVKGSKCGVCSLDKQCDNKEWNDRRQLCSLYGNGTNEAFVNRGKVKVEKEERKISDLEEFLCRMENAVELYSLDYGDDDFEITVKITCEDGCCMMTVIKEDTK